MRGRSPVPWPPPCGLAAAFALDWLCAARGLLPPGFRDALAPAWQRGLSWRLSWAVGVPAPAAAVTGPAVEPPNLSKIEHLPALPAAPDR